MKQQKEKEKEIKQPIVLEEHPSSFSVGVGEIVLSSTSENCQLLSGLLISILKDKDVKNYLEIYRKKLGLENCSYTG